jgi:predicted NAD-dependent protein-ADP-ribosyltransferase YbiA (DUF1768 family)
MKIIGFNDNNHFLSNFYNHSISYNGITYKNNVSAYLAQFFESRTQRVLFSGLLPTQAIRLFDRISNPHVEFDKEAVMKAICKEKFSDKFLKEKLLKTNDDELINETIFPNEFWGTNKKGEGQNKLGKILMEIRTEFSQEIEEKKKKAETEEKVNKITEETKKELKKNKKQKEEMPDAK